MSDVRKLANKIIDFKKSLGNIVQNNAIVDDQYYQLLRQELISSFISKSLPREIMSNTTIDEFSHFITQFPSQSDTIYYIKKAFEDVLYFLEMDNGQDLFKFQFPIGLPFGYNKDNPKPHMNVNPNSESQIVEFQLQTGMSILKEDIYPNFTFNDLCKKVNLSSLGLNEIKDWAKALVYMSQTDYEKIFLIKYAKTFEVRKKAVPILIPQAWIRWNSMSKSDLRQIGSTYADELYRIDFVAFWSNKRYAITLDDISHYGKKITEGEKITWLANEEEYSKRLKEDRTLKAAGWEVFRISNWELKQIDNNTIINEIFSDLREFIGF